MRGEKGRGLPRRAVLGGILSGIAGSAMLPLAGCTALGSTPPTPTTPPPTPTVPPPTPVPPEPTRAPTTAPTEAPPTPTVPAATPTTAPPTAALSTPSPSPASETPQPSPTARPSPSTAAETALRLATNHPAVEVPWFRKVLDTFARDNPAYRVEQTNVTARYLEQVATWAGEGALPDVVYVRSAHAAAWAYKRWIASIDDLVTGDGQAIGVADFHPSQVEELKLDGKWLLLPYDYSGQCLYSRADAYSDAGTPPRDDWTWTDLAAAAKRATQQSATGTRWGFAWAADAGSLPGLWLAEAGAFRRDDGRGIAVSSPDHVRITQWLADLALVEGSAPKPGEAGAGALTAGRLGSEVEGASAAAGYRAAGNRILATGLPKGAAGRRASYATGSGFAISQRTKDREGAWELLRHLSSRDSLEILVALPVRALPGRASAVPLWQAGVEAMGTLDHADAIVAAASEGYPHRQCVWWLNYQDVYGELMPAVWSGDKKAADVLPELEQRVNAAAARYFA